jgi:hypothetical protein
MRTDLEAVAWAYFILYTVKEAPEIVWRYVVLRDRLEDRRARRTLKPMRVKVKPALETDQALPIRPAILSGLTAHGSSSTRLELTTGGPAFLKLAPARGRASTRMELTTG